MNLEAASQEEIKKLYEEAGLDMGQVIVQALDSFKDLYLGADKADEGEE